MADHTNSPVYKAVGIIMVVIGVVAFIGVFLMGVMLHELASANSKVEVLTKQNASLREDVEQLRQRSDRNMTAFKRCKALLLEHGWMP
jgi:biopolymer transport protein ExbB/TolQ